MKIECTSRIVVFNKYKFASFKDVDGRIVKMITADIDKGYKIIEPSLELALKLQQINNVKDLLAYCHKFGIPTEGADLTTSDVIALLNSSNGAPIPLERLLIDPVEAADKHNLKLLSHASYCLLKSELGFDVLTACAEVDYIMEEVTRYQKCMKVANALKRYPNLTAEDEKLLSLIINETEEAYETSDVPGDYEKASLYLAGCLQDNIQPDLAQSQFKIQTNPILLSPYVRVLSPLTYAWFMLYNIMINTDPLNQCTKCGAYFISSHRDARFCGKKCRDAYYVSQKRSRLKNNTQANS